MKKITLALLTVGILSLAVLTPAHAAGGCCDKDAKKEKPEEKKS